MLKLDEKIIKFFKDRDLIYAATADKAGVVNIAIKGIAKMDSDGIVYLVDLYDGQTRKNLAVNPNLTIGTVSKRYFSGWQLKGIAKEYNENETDKILETWDKEIIKRMTLRLIDNIKKKKKLTHSEINLPKPKYIIKMQVHEIIDLSGK